MIRTGDGPLLLFRSRSRQQPRPFADAKTTTTTTTSTTAPISGGGGGGGSKRNNLRLMNRRSPLLVIYVLLTSAAVLFLLMNVYLFVQQHRTETISSTFTTITTLTGENRLQQQDSLSSTTRRRRRTQGLLPEQHLLERLQRELEERWKTCNKRTTTTTTSSSDGGDGSLRVGSRSITSTTATTAPDNNLLKPFGLLTSLQKYQEQQLLAAKGENDVRDANNVSNNNYDAINATDTVPATTHTTITTTTSTTCQSPKEAVPACKVSTYAIIAFLDELETTTHHDPHLVGSRKSTIIRTLVLNCMKWLLDPAAKEIWILLPEEKSKSRLLLESDHDDYASRLMAWSAQPDHPVRVVFSSPTSKFSSNGNSLWKAVAHVADKTDQTAVIWMKGGTEFQGDVKGTQEGFRRWREEPSGIYAPEARTLAALLHNRSVLHLLPCGGLDSVDGGESDSNSSDVSSRSLFLLPDVSMQGLIHHVSYLCFLQHPVLEDLRLATTITTSTTPMSWRLTRFAIALWLAHSTPMDIDIYPVRGRVDDSIDADNTSFAGSFGVYDKRRRRNSTTRKTPERDGDNVVVQYFNEILPFFGGLPLARPRFPRNKPAVCI